MLFIFFLLLSAGLIELWIGIGQAMDVLLYGLSYHSVTGTFGNSGLYSIFIAILLPIAWTYTLRIRSFRKENFKVKGLIALSFLYVLLSLFVLPVSMGRTSWLAALTGCGVVTFLSVHERWGKRAACRLAVALVGLPVLCAGVGYGLKKDSADGRLLIWKISAPIVKDCFPQGAGEGNFPGVYGEAQEAYFRSGKGTEQEAYIAGAPNFAYNEYLQIAIEHGLTGIIALLLVAGYSFVRLKSSNNTDRVPLAGAFAALLVAAFFSYPFRNPYTCLLAAGIVILTASLPNSKESSTHKRLRWGIGLFVFLSIAWGTGKQQGAWGNKRIARQQWEQLKPHFSAGQFEDIVKNYAVLYPYLKQEEAFMFEYGQCLSQTEAYEESNRILQEGLARSSDPMFLNIIGKNYHALGNDSLAEAMYRKAAWRIPHKIYPLYLLMELYRQQGKETEWKAIAHRILEKKEKIHSPETEYIKKKVKEAIQDSDK